MVLRIGTSCVFSIIPMSGWFLGNGRPEGVDESRSGHQSAAVSASITEPWTGPEHLMFHLGANGE